jgi:hypothetical protein
MKEQGASVEFWSDPRMPYVETRRACASRACYKAHSHPTFSIGAVDQGNSIFTSHLHTTENIDAGSIICFLHMLEHACNIARSGLELSNDAFDAGWLTNY